MSNQTFLHTDLCRARATARARHGAAMDTAARLAAARRLERRAARAAAAASRAWASLQLSAVRPR